MGASHEKPAGFPYGHKLGGNLTGAAPAFQTHSNYFLIVSGSEKNHYSNCRNVFETQRHCFEKRTGSFFSGILASKFAEFFFNNQKICIRKSGFPDRRVG